MYWEPVNEHGGERQSLLSPSNLAEISNRRPEFRWDWTLVRALCPLLAVYLVVTLVNWPTQWAGDELRYLQFAHNLSHGRYALDNDDYLCNGPGYPLLLAAWNATGMPPLWARFGNAGLLFLAVTLFAHLMVLYVPRRWALGTAWGLGLHVPLYTALGLMMTESLAVCVICGAFLAAAVTLRTGSRAANASRDCYWAGWR